MMILSVFFQRGKESVLIEICDPDENSIIEKHDDHKGCKKSGVDPCACGKRTDNVSDFEYKTDQAVHGDNTHAENTGFQKSPEKFSGDSVKERFYEWIPAEKNVKERGFLICTDQKGKRRCDEPYHP